MPTNTQIQAAKTILKMIKTQTLETLAKDCISEIQATR